MKILIWVGYANPAWSKTTWENNGIGGTEYCAIKLADYLDINGCDVTISGDVETGNWHGVQYIHHYDLIEKRGPRGLNHKSRTEVYEHYDVVIGLSYIHFLKHLEDARIEYDRAYFWMHNEDFYSWYRGKLMDENEVKMWVSKLDGVVGVSNYHMNEYVKPRFKALGYTPQQLNTYIHSIDNAIDLNDYKNVPFTSKIKDRIIWTSSPDRGLKLILDNWLEWKTKIPSLSLEICCPPYAVDWFKDDISELPDVNWQGNRCPRDLKIEILKAEYWIYSSDYSETYCISALEMMMGNVKIITNGTGNLKNLVTEDRGTIVGDDVNEIWEAIIADKINPAIMGKKVNNAYNFACGENWKVRTQEWLNLIKPNV
tara:strand:- start:179 stop:1288 length:1110 start_codon:yes stop_codon:yes gene_type:complete